MRALKALVLATLAVAALAWPQDASAANLTLCNTTAKFIMVVAVDPYPTGFKASPRLPSGSCVQAAADIPSGQYRIAFLAHGDCWIDVSVGEGENTFTFDDAVDAMCRRRAEEQDDIFGE